MPARPRVPGGSARAAPRVGASCPRCHGQVRRVRPCSPHRSRDEPNSRRLPPPFTRGDRPPRPGAAPARGAGGGGGAGRARGGLGQHRRPGSANPRPPGLSHKSVGSHGDRGSVWPQLSPARLGVGSPAGSLLPPGLPSSRDRAGAGPLPCPHLRRPQDAVLAHAAGALQPALDRQLPAVSPRSPRAA